MPEVLPCGYFPMAPDLAVEVLSPDDRPGEVLAKVADWLEAGSTIVWLVDPDRRTVRVYRADGTESVLSATDSLRCDELLPGFLLPLPDLWLHSATQ